LSAAL